MREIFETLFPTTTGGEDPLISLALILAVMVGGLILGVLI